MIIFPVQVKHTSLEFLRSAFKEYPGTLRDVIRDPEFTRWCEDCANKLTQLAQVESIAKRLTNWNITRYIQDQCILYAEKVLGGGEDPRKKERSA